MTIISERERDTTKSDPMNKNSKNTRSVWPFATNKTILDSIPTLNLEIEIKRARYL